MSLEDPIFIFSGVPLGLGWWWDLKRHLEVLRVGVEQSGPRSGLSKQ